MKKHIIKIILVVLVIGFIVCGLKIVERYTKKYYTLEDFSSITIGESTAYDVHLVAPIRKMRMTGFGGMCEFPTKDGKYIFMIFYGSELVVGEIELRENTTMD